MPKTIIKLTNLEFPQHRYWYNDWLERNASGNILDVGKSTHWDYSNLSYGYKTLDNNSQLNPHIVADICDNTVCSNAFDMVLCNGMYECVDNPQKMVDEVYRILKPKGTAIFGFVGKDYVPYKPDWKSYNENIDFKEFQIKEVRDFGKHYHFIICQKPMS